MDEPQVARGELQARALRMVRREIMATLRPELTSAYTRHVADMLAVLLDNLALWDGMPSVADDRAALCERLAGTATGTAGRTPRLDDGAAVGNALAALVRAADDRALPAIATAIAEADFAMLQAEASAVAAANAGEDRLLATLDLPVTAERLESWFAGAPALAAERVASILRLPGGYSKDTFLVGCQSGREIVVRRDFPFGPTESSAPNEFGLLRALADRGLPVALPILAETDRSVLGQPFLVVEKVAGSDAANFARDQPALASKVALDLAVTLGRIHAVDPAEVGLAATAASPADQVRDYIAGWQRWWHRHRIHDSALAEAAFRWLFTHIPQQLERLVIVHGDARPANMLVDDHGGITALLDWEFAHAGDAGEDIAYARTFVAEYLDWPDFEQAYLRAGGVPTSVASLEYYDLWWALRNFVCLDVSWGGFIHDRYPVFKLGAAALVFRREVAGQLADRMRRIAW